MIVTASYAEQTGEAAINAVPRLRVGGMKT
jgi:hypothetical protein